MELFRTAWKFIAFFIRQSRNVKLTAKRPHSNIDSVEYVLCQSIDLTFYLLGGNLFFSNIKDWQSFCIWAHSVQLKFDNILMVEWVLVRWENTLNLNLNIKLSKVNFLSNWNRKTGQPGQPKQNQYFSKLSYNKF